MRSKDLNQKKKVTIESCFEQLVNKFAINIRGKLQEN